MCPICNCCGNLNLTFLTLYLLLICPPESKLLPGPGLRNLEIELYSLTSDLSSQIRNHRPAWLVNMSVHTVCVTLHDIWDVETVAAALPSLDPPTCTQQTPAEDLSIQS